MFPHCRAKQRWLRWQTPGWWIHPGQQWSLSPPQTAQPHSGQAMPEPIALSNTPGSRPAWCECHSFRPGLSGTWFPVGLQRNAGGHRYSQSNLPVPLVHAVPLYSYRNVSCPKQELLTVTVHKPQVKITYLDGQKDCVSLSKSAARNGPLANIK